MTLCSSWCTLVRVWRQGSKAVTQSGGLGAGCAPCIAPRGALGAARWLVCACLELAEVLARPRALLACFQVMDTAYSRWLLLSVSALLRRSSAGEVGFHAAVSITLRVGLSSPQRGLDA